MGKTPRSAKHKLAHIVNAKLTQDEIKFLRKYAKDNGLYISEVVRNCIIAELAIATDIYTDDTKSKPWVKGK